MKKVLIWSVVVVALFAFGACGGGDGKTTRLFGVTVGNGTLGDSVLVMLSPDDGSFISTIGSTGHRINGLEYDAASNKLYGTTSFHDPSFSYGLIEIDMSTAAATTIGLAGIDIQAITANSDGELYAWSESEVSGGDDLISVDPVTGVATTLGDSGVGTSEYGLAFDSNDDLYLVNQAIMIYTIDTVSGAATFSTDLNTGNDIAHHGDVHPETGYYWGIGENWGNAEGPYTPNLIVIDLNTPAIIDSTLTTVDNLHAITFFRD